MAQKHSNVWPIVTAVVAVILFVIALPDGARKWAPGFLRAPTFHFGLDLAGGTELDFRISQEEMIKEIASIKADIATAQAQGGNGQKIAILQNQLQSIQQQQTTIVEAIRTVLERRINALGVSEASITPSYIGNEKHLLVECPGVVDTQKCINTVGKTIQLEFKEEQTEPTPEYEKQVRDRVRQAQLKLRQPDQTLGKLGEDLGSEIGISYKPSVRFFKDELPKGLEGIWSKTPAAGVSAYDAVIKVNGTDSAGQPALTDMKGVFLAEVLQPRTSTGRTVNEAPKAFDILAASGKQYAHTAHLNEKLDAQVPAALAQTIRDMQPGDLKSVTLDNGAAIVFLRKFTPGQTQLKASHILVSYKGAASAGAGVTRTKQEALTLALQLKQQVDKGANFESLARAQSDGPSAKQGGSLGTFGLGTMVPAFEQAALQMKTGQISAPVETQFGYHLIRLDSAPKPTADVASYELLSIKGATATQDAQNIIGDLQRGAVRSQEDQIVVRTLFFSLMPTGWKDTPLDGKHFRSASVTMDPTTNIPVVQIAFDDEGGRLFAEITKKSVGKRIAIFVGGQLVSAPTVQQEILGGTAVITGSQNFDEANKLAQDLNTGAIPAPIYLAGQRTVEATLGDAALKMSITAALIGTLILMAFMILMYRMLGLIADIALAFYALIFVAMLKLPLFLITSDHIVLTLAGMAGIILSIGLAVDANVLIFERTKEEIRKGKVLKTAIETGFLRAWPSIRDGNVATVITASILFVIGTSIVRGFAVTLSLGVLISLFTAIIVTRFFIRRIAATPLADKIWLFAKPPRKENV